MKKFTALLFSLRPYPEARLASALMRGFEPLRRPGWSDLPADECRPVCVLYLRGGGTPSIAQQPPERLSVREAAPVFVRIVDRMLGKRSRHDADPGMGGPFIGFGPGSLTDLPADSPPGARCTWMPVTGLEAS